MSNAKTGYGTKVFMGAATDTAQSALTKLAEIFSATLPNEQTADIEVTHYESPGRTREFIAGLIDAGPITVQGNYIAGSATDDLIVAAKASGDVRPFRIGVNGETGQGFSFVGIITGYERNIPVDNRQTFSLTIRVAGAVTQADLT